MCRGWYQEVLPRNTGIARPSLASCPAADIQVKIAVIVFRCLHGLAPSYQAKDCVLVSAARGRRHLPSADTMKLPSGCRLSYMTLLGPPHIVGITVKVKYVDLYSASSCSAMFLHLA